MNCFRVFLASVLIFAMLLSGCQQQTITSGVQSGSSSDSSSQNVFTAALDVPVAVDRILAKFPAVQGVIQKILANPAMMKEIENAVKACRDVACFETRLIGSAKRGPGSSQLSAEQYLNIRSAYLRVVKNPSESFSTSQLASSWSGFQASGLALTADAGASESGMPPGSEDVAAVVPALALVGVMIVAAAITVGCSALVDATAGDTRFLVYLIGFGSYLCAAAAGIGTVVSFFSAIGQLLKPY
jgi:hypothetical protein